MLNRGVLSCRPHLIITFHPAPTLSLSRSHGSSKAKRATARPERRITESTRACPSRPSVPVVASGDAGEGAGVSLPIAPPLRRDERDAAATSRYRGKPTFVTAIPSSTAHANAENAETTPRSVAAADCAAMNTPKQLQGVCCGRVELDDGPRLNDAADADTAIDNNSCNCHQASVDSTTQERRHCSPPPSTAATAGAAATAILLNTAEAAPKPWTLVNKMFTNNTARLRGRAPHRTAQQARTLPKTAPAGLGKGGGGSSYNNKQKRPRESQPSAMGTSPTATSACRFSRRWNKTAEEFVGHVAQGLHRGAAGNDMCVTRQEHQPLGRLKVTQGVTGLTFSRSGCFDPEDDSLGGTGSDGGTTDGLSPRWGGGSESPTSSSIWSVSSCDSMSDSTWSGASFDGEVRWKVGYKTWSQRTKRGTVFL